VTGAPDSEGFGKLSQGFLELSNVEVVDEMVNMIVAQRAYELNARAIQTSEEMLANANNLKR
jgi:flagellar basal-body rod protein FlgG